MYRIIPADRSGPCADPSCQEKVHIGDPAIVVELIDRQRQRQFFYMHADCAQSFGKELSWSLG